ncbi:hypothetical protein [Enterococcus faecium]|uniref:hypothetical protein n=1 Tax=Enterococcus TaxID=1350 RepID=UPI0018E65EF5|nr:hypothetical protein [Enterococcus faecium]MDW7896162.1 hypothetical protein [Enterococcus faecium]NTP77674.1 hypothetical protein [Enterococcus faecium]
MKWKEKVDEVAEKLYDLVKSEKYDIEVNIPKKGEKAVHVKSKRPTNHTKKWMAKNR